MPKALVIVETEAKAATIAACMGPDFRVEATNGSLRTLPAGRLGFELEPPYELDFQVPESQRRRLWSLAKAAEGCPVVYLCMDLDPEGELDAWNVREALRPMLPAGVAFKRARACELTTRGMRQAFRYAGILDMDAVEAQKARRILDRLVAQGIAPHLWANVGKGISLGRLQAVALRLLCSREHDRENAKPVTRWRYAVRASGRAEPDTDILFRLVDADGHPLVVTDKDRAQVIKTALGTALVTVDTVRRESDEEAPPPPFTTETLLADAAAVLGLSPARTQTLAQQLYEGVDFGEGPVGLITFPRTTETRMAQPARADGLAYIAERFGEAYANADPDAETVTLGWSEAIRPTRPEVVPESLKGRLDPASLQLYTLVWRRAMASLMAPTRIERSIGVVDALAADGVNGFQLHAVAETVTFRGHRVLTQTIAPKPDDVFAPDVPLDRLPALSPGEALRNAGCVVETTGPQPVRRYTEADFVRALMAGGLGRPSTLAQTIGSLYQRKFAERQDRQMVPTEIGRRTALWVFSVFPGLMSSAFAANAESDIDAIAAGRETIAGLTERFVARYQRIWAGESREERMADPDHVAVVLQAMESIVNWGSANTRPPPGSDPAQDEGQFEEFRSKAAGKGLTENEFEDLLSLFFRYRPQIPRYVEAVKAIERFDLLELPDTAPDARIIQLKMEWVDKAPLSPESKRFVESLKHQSETGRHLTEAQVRVLDEILAAQALRIEGLTKEILDEMGIVPRTQEDLDTIQRLLDALASVKEWRPPSQRGKRLYDDAAFAASVSDQFRRRGDLSPAQLTAVKKMVARYHDKIPNYAELAPLYGLPPEGAPQPRLFGGGRRRKNAAPPSDSRPIPPPPPPRPLSPSTPNYDDL